MLSLPDIQMENVVIHKVGNKLRQEGLVFSKSCIQVLDEEIQQLLFQYLLSPFQKIKTINRFSHTTDIRFNEVYMYVSQVFDSRDSFLEQSENIARHLYEKSLHPRIKGGEFYMVYFRNFQFNDVVTDAVGMFRTENKETYLKVVDREDSFGVEYDNGININALDKGCLVLNIDGEIGYKVLIVDAHGKGANEARYWREDFLRVETIQTEDAITQSCMEMVGRFVNEKIVEEEKIKPVELKSKAVQFFEENDTFEMSRFEEEVLQEPTYIEAFREYRDQYQETSGTEPPDQFHISHASVQATKKKIRSVIKLDTFFDIYLRTHNPRNLQYIERGHDDAKGMNYYKIYFNREN